MLDAVDAETLDQLIDQTIPAAIRLAEPMTLAGASQGCSEAQALAELSELAAMNRPMKSLLGLGYHGTITPPTIQRNVLENPLWYTPYTPYQAEIAQGRLEALLNFQTMVSDLTGLPLSNASLLDEATAAAEAMAMCFAIGRQKRQTFFASVDCHPQTLAVVRTRARTIGLKLVIGKLNEIPFGDDLCGVLLQYPASDGCVLDYSAVCAKAHEHGAQAVVACDLLALCLLRPPGEFGADIAVGSTQRFGMPMGYGGPHAAFLATHEKHARKVPGRLVGVTRDAHGQPALRLAIQTREQHIKRERATSNICTAQVLPAVVASMFAVWHGPVGLKRIAERVHGLALSFAGQLASAGLQVDDHAFFDTVSVCVGEERAQAIVARAQAAGFNLRVVYGDIVLVCFDETSTVADLESLVEVFVPEEADAAEEAAPADDTLASFYRASPYLQQPVFNTYHTEHEFLRYVTRLQSRDISLAHSMIPLGSCTMKLNAAAEMMPVTWPGFAQLHPYAPVDQALGYRKLFEDLASWLGTITGLPGVSLQPNAGSQGEYAGLLAIKRLHEAAGGGRDICLIPTSAHGTNPASAVICGMKVVPIACRDNGDIDLDDLRAKATQHADRLAALMITYPSTHGVFEQTIREACAIVHEQGGRVYMDGANMNAQVGLTSPGVCGADVCHLNLHKTFCIPHGGGGPGMGPICCTEELTPYLPGGVEDEGMVSAAPFGSPMILPISWMYIRMMGGDGLTEATKRAILNANYLAARLRGAYDVLYTGENGRSAHEFILDGRPFAKQAHVSVEDIAKRLIDFGYHAPTMSWPVSGTLMIEPTESESKAELDRFADAMLAIRAEIRAIEDGELDQEDNPLKHAPHTAAHVCGDSWPHTYPREQAAYPVSSLREHKVWPAVGRVDNAYGDKNLVCTCDSVEAYA